MAIGLNALVLCSTWIDEHSSAYPSRIHIDNDGQ